MSKGWTQTDVESHYARIGKRTPINTETVYVAAPPKRIGLPKRTYHEVPLNVNLTLHGHVPSKKNAWQRGESGVMFIPEQEKEQINALTLQAAYAWSKVLLPVDHPDLTVTFYVLAKRQDQDGMYTTILDCLQAAGVIVNDNIAHFNGTKILKPCVMVTDAQDERVEIEIRKDR